MGKAMFPRFKLKNYEWLGLVFTIRYNPGKRNNNIATIAIASQGQMNGAVDSVYIHRCIKLTKIMIPPIITKLRPNLILLVEVFIFFTSFLKLNFPQNIYIKEQYFA